MKHILNIIICAVVIAALSASAELVTEYFQYGDTYGNLTSFTTTDTAGWGANAWSLPSGAVPHYTNFPVSFGSKYGEANSYINTNVGGSVIANPNGNGGIVTRSFSPALNGTVWLSTVFTSSFWNGSLDLLHVKFRINNDANDFIGLASEGWQNRLRWWVHENGVAYSNAYYLQPAAGQCGGLLVARLRTDYSGTDDDITIWIFTNKCEKLNGRTAADLGTEVHQSSVAQDIWGSSISSLGIDIKKSNVGGRDLAIDGLRISKGNISDDEHVYEILTGVTVPEPGVIGLAVLALVAMRRK